MADHKLVSKDVENLTGVCSVDGPVKIRRAGNGFQCAVAKAAAHKRWATSNPHAAAANRRRRSAHLLSGRDRDAMTAHCSKCGPVALVPWGRGVACVNLATARRTVQEKASQKACRECYLIDRSKTWLAADGSCPRCSDESPYVLSHVPPERRDPGGRVRWELAMLGETTPDQDDEGEADDRVGFSIVTADATFAEVESAIPGWKTIGSDKPWNEV